MGGRGSSGGRDDFGVSSAKRPNLSGTEKQVEWANDLRNQFISEWASEIRTNHRLISALDGKREADRVSAETASAVKMIVSNRDTAKSWIDDRGHLSPGIDDTVSVVIDMQQRRMGRDRIVRYIKTGY